MARASVVFPVPLAPAIAILICVWPFEATPEQVAFSKNTYRADVLFGDARSTHTSSPEAPAKSTCSDLSPRRASLRSVGASSRRVQHDGCVLFELGPRVPAPSCGTGPRPQPCLRRALARSSRPLGAPRGSCAPGAYAAGPTASGPPDPRSLALLRQAGDRDRNREIAGSGSNRTRNTHRDPASNVADVEVSSGRVSDLSNRHAIGDSRLLLPEPRLRIIVGDRYAQHHERNQDR